MATIRKSAVVMSILALIASVQLFDVPSAHAGSCTRQTTVEFIFREADNRLAEDINWILYKQERNFDGGRYLGRTVRSGKVEDEGSVNFTFDPARIPSASGRGGSTAFALKVYDINREAGAVIFWDVIIPCSTTVRETYTLPALSVIIRDNNGVPIERHPFQVFTQARTFDNMPIIDETVSTRLNTGEGGQEVIHLAPGEYIIRIPVPGSRGQLYEESVVVRPETVNRFDYRAGNVRMTIRDGKGTAVENASVELYEQVQDAFGNPALGVRKGSTRTNVSGEAVLFQQAGTYALKVSGPNRSVYTFFNVTVVSESNTVVEKRLSTLEVSTRDENGSLTKGVRVSIAPQSLNSDGEPTAGRAIQTVSSNETGIATFYVAPGTYAITANRETVYNIVVTEGKTAAATYRKTKPVQVQRGPSGEEIVVKGIVFDALPSGSLVKTANSPAVYFIEKGKLRVIPDEATFLALNFKWEAINVISQDEFDEYPKGLPLRQILGAVLAEGTLAKSDQSPAVFLITEGAKRVFHDAYSFEVLGYDWDNVHTVTTFVLDQYPAGEQIKVPVGASARLIKSTDNPVVYLLEGGLKRPYETEEAFFADGHSWDEVLIVPFAEVRNYPLGATIR